MMDISTDVVRAYLTKIGKTVSDAEALTQAEFNAFVEEVHHKTGESKVWLLRVLENAELVGAHVIEHIREILGADASLESESFLANKAAKAAADAKAAKDAADALVAEQAAADAKAADDKAAADQAAAAAKEAEDSAALAAQEKATQDAFDAAAEGQPAEDASEVAS